MERSTSAINDHSSDQDQEIEGKSILNDFKTTPETLDSQTPESLVDRIQDCSSSNTKAGEPAESDVNTIPSFEPEWRQTRSEGRHRDLPSANHHYYPNLQPGYGFGSTFSGPFMPGYHPHDLQPGFYAPQPGYACGYNTHTFIPSYTSHFLHEGQSSTSFGAHLAQPEQFDCDESQNLSLLEEFIKSNNGRNFELSDIKGCIVNFSFDQEGSRFIQQKLEHCSEEDKMTVFNEVVPRILGISFHSYGNYLITKLLELGSAEQRNVIAEKLSGNMVSLSFDKFACRVIQKALEVIDHEQKLHLIKELDGYVMKCVHDRNGNHVIRKCIECLPIQETRFIISSFQGQVPKLSMHQYGCRVIQSVLEHYLDESQCRCIVNEILKSAFFLSQDHHGNYVIQCILKRGKLDDRSQFIGKLTRKVVEMSQHKYASNVIETCLEYGNAKEQELLIEKILNQSNGEDNVLAMMKDQYGNYVVQKALDVANERQREALTSRMKVNLSSLRKYTFGKHIAALCDRLSVEGP